MKIKLIIGIGNPDEQYKDTRHNVGFMFLDYLAKKLEADGFEFDKKTNALISKTKLTKLEKTPVTLSGHYHRSTVLCPISSFPPEIFFKISYVCRLKPDFFMRLYLTKIGQAVSLIWANRYPWDRFNSRD